jgi:hypothetical protein
MYIEISWPCFTKKMLPNNGGVTTTMSSPCSGHHHAVMLCIENGALVTVHWHSPAWQSKHAGHNDMDMDMFIFISLVPLTFIATGHVHLYNAEVEVLAELCRAATVARRCYPQGEAQA